MMPFLIHRLTVARSILSSLATSDALRNVFIHLPYNLSNCLSSGKLLHLLHQWKKERLDKLTWIHHEKPVQAKWFCYSVLLALRWRQDVVGYLVFVFALLKKLHHRRDDFNRKPISAAVSVLVETKLQFALHEHEHSPTGVFFNCFRELIP